jgi:hypothetical protein
VTIGSGKTGRDDTVDAPAAKLVPRVVRAHLFLTVFVALALLGGGLRFIPTSAAAPAGSSSAGAGASTSCAAK